MVSRAEAMKDGSKSTAVTASTDWRTTRVKKPSEQPISSAWPAPSIIFATNL